MMPPAHTVTYGLGTESFSGPDPRYLNGAAYQRAVARRAALARARTSRTERYSTQAWRPAVARQMGAWLIGLGRWLGAPPAPANPPEAI